MAIESTEATISAATREGNAFEHLAQAGELGVMTVTAVMALDTAEHWLISRYKNK